MDAAGASRPLLDSLGLKRVLRSLQHTLPRDARLGAGGADVHAAVRAGVQALGHDPVLEAARVFARFDLNGDGSISPREGLHMKTELRSLLPSGASIIPDPGKTLDFVEFCSRIGAAHASATASRFGTALAEQAIAAETAELMRTHASEDGTLGLLEFRRVMLTLSDKYGWDGSSVTALRRFHECDTARNGKLRAEQLEAMLTQLHVRQGRDASPAAVRSLTTGGAGGGASVGMLPASPTRKLGSSPLSRRPPKPIARAATLGNLLEVRPPGGLADTLTDSFSSGDDRLHESFHGVNSKGVPTVWDPATKTKRTTRDPFFIPQRAGQSEEPKAVAEPAAEAGVRAAKKATKEETYDEKYMENLLRNAEATTAQRDALEGLPNEEKKLIASCFQRFDPTCQYMLDQEGFVGFWKAVVTQQQHVMRSTPHGAAKVTVACLLLNEVAACDRPAHEVAALFSQSDSDNSGWVDLNEAVAALIDCVDENYSRIAHRCAVGAQDSSIARRDYRTVDELAAAYPVAVRLMRELDLDHGGALGREEFVRGMRLVLETCARLSPPLLGTMARERKRLVSFFEDYDLNHDKNIDVNEWMLMLPYLHRSFLAALSVSGDAPHRNRVLKAIRMGKKVIAECRQQQLFDAVDRGEELPEGPVDPALMLSGLAAAASAESGEDHNAKFKKPSMAGAVMAQKERREEKKKAKGRKRRNPSPKARPR